MSLAIHPLRAFSDNYIWAIVNQTSQQVIVVDPGEAEPVEDFLIEHQLQLSEILITHKHFDHIGGVEELRKQHPHVKVTAHSQHTIPLNDKVDSVVEEGSEFQIWGNNVEVWHTAGHTENHLTYLLTLADTVHVFCGDTLFSGGCGRVFTGDMSAMYQSLYRLSQLDDSTLFYPAHEYTASNVRFGLHIEPSNQAMKNRLAKVIELTENGKPSLPTSLAHEKQENIFLRTDNQPVMQAIIKYSTELTNQDLALQQLNQENQTKLFSALRKIKDSF